MNTLLMDDTSLVAPSPPADEARKSAQSLNQVGQSQEQVDWAVSEVELQTREPETSPGLGCGLQDRR